MNPGRVDQNNLPRFAPLLFRDINDSENTVARGLRLRRNDRQFLADQRVQQSALAGIGATENADEAGVKRHIYTGY